MVVLRGSSRWSTVSTLTATDSETGGNDEEEEHEKKDCLQRSVLLKLLHNELESDKLCAEKGQRRSDKEKMRAPYGRSGSGNSVEDDKSAKENENRKLSKTHARNTATREEGSAQFEKATGETRKDVQDGVRPATNAFAPSRA